MGNCLITKLKGIVDNDNLNKFGQLIIKVVNNGASGVDAQRLLFGNLEPVTVSVTGNGTFSTTYGGSEYDKDHPLELPVNQAAHSLYFSTGEYNILITGKYSWHRLEVEVYPISIFSFDLDAMKYCTNMMTLRLRGINIYKGGDLSFVENMPLITLDLNSDQVHDNVSGDISVLSGKTNLQLLDLSGSFVTGNISALSSLTQLQNLYIRYLRGEGVSGNISDLSGLNNLTVLQLEQNTLITGDANIFADNTKFTSLTNLNLYGCTGISNRTDEVKTLIQAAHPGITVTW